MVGGKHRGGCKNEAYVAGEIAAALEANKKRPRAKKKEVLEEPANLDDWRKDVQ